MKRPAWTVAAMTAVAVIALTIGTVAAADAAHGGGSDQHPHGRVALVSHRGYGLDGVNETLTAAGTYGAALVKHEQEVAAAAERERLRQEAAARSRASRSHSSPTITGSCASMKPAGFPDYIIWRESRGDPNALNSSGAWGCAQILKSHFNSGATCDGPGYQDCWEKMYREQGLTPWACTPESGCG